LITRRKGKVGKRKGSKLLPGKKQPAKNDEKAAQLSKPAFLSTPEWHRKRCCTTAQMKKVNGNAQLAQTTSGGGRTRKKTHMREKREPKGKGKSKHVNISGSWVK